jgi:hypothetical protein
MKAATKKVVQIIVLASLALVLMGASPAAAPVAVTGSINTASNFSSSPTLDEFVSNVSGGSAEQLAGLYVENVLALPVVQQPSGNAVFVSSREGEVTQFSLASKFGNTGILAHNYLAGQAFFNIQLGDEIVLVKGNGSQVVYRVREMHRFQALSPNSPYSKFIDMSDPNQTQISATDLFYRTFGAGQGNLVLQTCITEGDEPSWGRLFIIAEPVPASQLVFEALQFAVKLS